MSKGIDISFNQKNVNWQVLKGGGVEFVFPRLGYGEINDPSGGVIDSEARYNLQNGLAFGVPMGPYMFSYAVNPDEAAREAEFVINLLAEFGGPANFPYPIWLDCEDQKYQGDVDINPIIDVFCSKLIQAGYKSGFYCNLSWLQNKVSAEIRAKYPFWLAQYNTTADAPCDIWQYTSKGSVPGVNGNVDMNECYTDFLGAGYTPVTQPIDIPQVLEPIYPEPVFSIREEQRFLNMCNFASPLLDEDGVDGELTQAARRNAQAGYGIDQDGIPGPITEYYERGQLRAVQNRLCELGYGVDVDGRLGDDGVQTTNAVEAFQRDRGLDVDHIIGNNTYNAMFTQPVPAPEPEPQPQPSAGGLKYFTADEFKCADDCGLDVRPELKQKIDQLREILGAPIIISSGARCPAQNARDGGVWDSLHLTGEASDIYTPGMSNAMVDRIRDIAQSLGLGTIRYYPEQFVHVQLWPRDTID